MSPIFFPEYTVDDIIKTYAIFGGIPYYLQFCDAQEPLRNNVIKILLTETGTLIDEPNTLLQTELRDSSFYSSVVAAVSNGCNTKSEIANPTECETRRYCTVYGKAARA